MPTVPLGLFLTLIPPVLHVPRVAVPTRAPAPRCASEGHLFVVQGDISRIVADAVLFPTRNIANPRWFPDGAPSGAEPIPRSRFTHTDRVHRVVGTPDTEPAIWLGWLWWEADGDAEFGWFLAAAEQFLQRAHADIGDRPDATSLCGRYLPLLALPVVGTGSSGARPVSGVHGASRLISADLATCHSTLLLPLAAHTLIRTCNRRAGALLNRLIQLLRRFVDTHRVDVVLVTKSRRMFSAAQAARLQIYAPPRIGESGEFRPESAEDEGRGSVPPSGVRSAIHRASTHGPWSSLGAPLIATARRLAALSARNQLVLYLGASSSPPPPPPPSLLLLLLLLLLSPTLTITGSGIGRSTNLPGWSELLEDVGASAGLDDAELAQLRRLALTDQVTTLPRSACALQQRQREQQQQHQDPHHHQQQQGQQEWERPCRRRCFSTASARADSRRSSEMRVPVPSLPSPKRRVDRAGATVQSCCRSWGVTSCSASPSRASRRATIPSRMRCSRHCRTARLSRRTRISATMRRAPLRASGSTCCRMTRDRRSGAPRDAISDPSWRQHGFTSGSSSGENQVPVISSGGFSSSTETCTTPRTSCSPTRPQLRTARRSRRSAASCRRGPI